MAKKDTKAAPAKTVKPTASKAATANRRPMKTAPDAPGSDTVQTGTPVGVGTRANMSPEEVYRLIQETAYYKAKARGFAPGHEVQDWIEAEAEVRMRLDTRV